MLPDHCTPATDAAVAPQAPVDAPVPLSLPDQIRALLQQSRAAHQAKKRCAGLANKAGIVTSPPNYAQAEAHIREAIRLREEAHQLDPDRTTPAWAEDLAANKGVASLALLQFFREYLLIP